MRATCKQSLPGLAILIVLMVAMPQACAEAVGTVLVVKGSASRVAASGARSSLNRGDKIHEGDLLSTQSKTWLGVRFDDNTRFHLGPTSRFRVDQVDDSDTGGFSAEVLQGAFRFVTGLISKRRPGAMRVKTGAVATIGIRGTTVAGEVVGESATVVLLEDEDKQQHSAIEVGNAHGSVVIDQAGYGTRVPDANSPPSPPQRMTLRTIESLVRNINNIQRIAVPRPMIR